MDAIRHDGGTVITPNMWASVEEYIDAVRAEPGVDAIRALRGWLKRGLRDFGLRCLEVREEPQTQETKMPIDLTDTKPQSSPIPPGIYRLRAKLMAGTAGSDYLLKRAKNGVQLMLRARVHRARGTSRL